MFSAFDNDLKNMAYFIAHRWPDFYTMAHA